MSTFPTLDPDSLEQVIGGVTLAAGGGKKSNDDFQTQLALQNLQSSIKDIGRSQNQGSDQTAMMLPLMMMMKQRQGG